MNNFKKYMIGALTALCILLIALQFKSNNTVQVLLCVAGLLIFSITSLAFPLKTSIFNVTLLNLIWLTSICLNISQIISGKHVLPKVVVIICEIVIIATNIRNYKLTKSDQLENK